MRKADWYQRESKMGVDDGGEDRGLLYVRRYDNLNVLWCDREVFAQLIRTTIDCKPNSSSMRLDRKTECTLVYHISSNLKTDCIATILLL